jgi:hypothetical protein
MRLAPLLIAFLPAMTLAQTAAAPTTKPAAGKSSDEDKVVCKSIPEAGSLISTKRECHTRREWAEESQAAQRRLSDCTVGSGATGARC